jgi:hypothetical protein
MMRGKGGVKDSDEDETLDGGINCNCEPMRKCLSSSISLTLIPSRRFTPKPNQDAFNQADAADDSEFAESGT